MIQCGEGRRGLSRLKFLILTPQATAPSFLTELTAHTRGSMHLFMAATKLPQCLPLSTGMSWKLHPSTISVMPMFLCVSLLLPGQLPCALPTDCFDSCFPLSVIHFGTIPLFDAQAVPSFGSQMVSSLPRLPQELLTSPKGRIKSPIDFRPLHSGDFSKTFHPTLGLQGKPRPPKCSTGTV